MLVIDERLRDRPLKGRVKHAARAHGPAPDDMCQHTNAVNVSEALDSASGSPWEYPRALHPSNTHVPLSVDHTAESVRDGPITTMTTLSEYLQGPPAWGQCTGMTVHRAFVASPRTWTPHSAAQPVLAAPANENTNDPQKHSPSGRGV